MFYFFASYITLQLIEASCYFSIIHDLRIWKKVVIMIIELYIIRIYIISKLALSTKLRKKSNINLSIA